MRSLTIRLLDQEDKEVYSYKGTFEGKYLSPNTKIDWTEKNVHGREDIKMINFGEAYENLIKKAEDIKNNSGPLTPEDFQYKIITEIK